MKRYAKVLVGLPVEGPFYYSVPKRFRKDVQRGKRAWVPFRNRRVVGYILDVISSSRRKQLKQLYSIMDDVPVISEEMFKLTRWMADYYCGFWGEAIEMTIPGALKKASVKKEIDTTPSQKSTRKAHSRIPSKYPELNSVIDCLRQKRHQLYLLYAEDCWMRYQAYTELIQRVESGGKSCILSFPEIGVATGRFLEYLKDRIAGCVSPLHSGLSAKQSHYNWSNIFWGLSSVVVGTRSAVFSPVKNLGLLIIDSEEDPLYKEKRLIKYNAREVALMRARINGLPILLGAACPSMETYSQLKKGKFHLIRLKAKRKDPAVKIVDMRRESTSKKKRPILSKLLQIRIEGTLAKKGRVILFLNRRGFSTGVICRKCGFLLRCPNCQIPLRYHYDRKMLCCHLCSFQTEPKDICPNCEGSYLSYVGAGTQRLESELHRLFPEADIQRLDLDTMERFKRTDEKKAQLRYNKVDIIVGTQMLTRCREFPMVELVGMLSVDNLLNLPDFRAGEDTFRLIQQLKDRAKQEFVVQTYMPFYSVIRRACASDYEGFFKQELKSRKELNLPPFSHLISVSAGSGSKDGAKSFIFNLAEELKPFENQKNFELLGPMPAIPRGRKYRWNILIKTKGLRRQGRFLKGILKEIKGYSKVAVSVDVDVRSLNW